MCRVARSISLHRFAGSYIYGGSPSLLPTAGSAASSNSAIIASTVVSIAIHCSGADQCVICF